MAAHENPVSARDGAERTMFEGEQDLITTERLAALLGVHVNTARTLCRTGELPAVKIGARYYVPRARLADFVAGGGDAA